MKDKDFNDTAIELKNALSPVLYFHVEDSTAALFVADNQARRFLIDCFKAKYKDEINVTTLFVGTPYYDDSIDIHIARNE